MSFFNIPELREQARRNGVIVGNANAPTIAIAHSNLGPGDATYILDQWATQLIQYAHQLGYNVVDISGQNLVYDRVTEILSQTKPAVLFNFGHGCRTYLMGNDMRCTLTRGWEDAQSCGVCGMPSNLKSIAGTAIIAYSCHSGAQLGKCAISYGSPAYVGFADNLIVVSDKYGTQNIFKDALLPLSYRILEGSPIGMAVDAARTMIYDAVKKFKPVELVSVPLWYNLKYLVLHGDPNWKLI